MSLPKIGDRVRFAPNPRYPDRKIEANVVRFRRRAYSRLGSVTLGWAETVDDDGVERSVAPTRCEVI